MNEDAHIAECRLDGPSLRSQRDRYQSLAAMVDEIVRERGAVAVRFGSNLDRDLLRETIAVERECCPFFSFDYTESERRLMIGVVAAEQDEALDALAFALGRAQG